MVTVKDVAKAAGVSPITVSRVINSPETVKESTRLRVQQAMRSLKYVTNTAARSLVANKTGIVDVYVPEELDISNPFVMHLIAGVSNVLSARMYSFLLLRSLKKEHPCDGYIVTGLARNQVQDFERYAVERQRRVVLFGHTESAAVNCIDVDNAAGSKLGVGRLLELGHKKVAMINVAEDKDYTDDRLAGYRSALEEAGLAYDGENVVCAENSPAGGAQAVRQLLGRGGFTAVFCATDTIGIGAAAELSRLGYRVPGDISLLGFDGMGHHLLASPPLTTVQQPVYEIGMMLAQTLLDTLDGREVQRSRLVMPKLLEGKSTAPPGPQP